MMTPFNGIRLNHPEALLLLPLAWIAYLFWVRSVRRRRQAVLLPWLQLVSLSLFPTKKAWLRKACLVGAVLGFILAVIALSQPQKIEDLSRNEVSGIDIMFAIDTSGSMIIEDLLPNRITAAMESIEKFVKRRDHDRMGLVVFGGESFTLLPLTLDRDIILQAVRSISPDMTRVEGTAIGTGLANAVSRLKNSTAKSRVIILLTDGVNNAGNVDPVTAADLAAGYDMRVYTIGIGKEGWVPMPVFETDFFGRKVKQMKQVDSSIDFPLLEEIAEKTKGKFFKATDEKALQKVFDEIDRLERSEIEGFKYYQVTELFPYALGPATALIAIAYACLLTFLRVVPQ
jgi:Ca-activated chloride channel family protein